MLSNFGQYLFKKDIHNKQKTPIKSNSVKVSNSMKNQKKKHKNKFGFLNIKKRKLFIFYGNSFDELKKIRTKHNFRF